MRFTHFLFAMIAVAITTPLIAEGTSKNHYIVKAGTTGRCEVVDVKPTPEGISAGLVYDSRVLADTALIEAARYEIPDCSLLGR